MKTEEKYIIHKALEEAISKGQTNSSISKSIKTSEAMISCCRNPNKWDNYSNGTPIPDKIWHALKVYLMVGNEAVLTSQYLQITEALLMAKQYSLASVIDGHTGSGKTHTIRCFQQANPNGTHVVTCARDFTNKSFIQEVAEVVRADSFGTQYDLRKNIAVKLASEDKPILILDEAENLTDGSYAAVKALYDSLEGRLGIVLVGANSYWEGLVTRSKRKGTSCGCFPQVVSRFRANVTKLTAISIEDVREACQVFGIVSKEEVKSVWTAAEDYRAVFGALKRNQRLAQLA